MSDIRFLRVVARWLSALMLAGVLSPCLPAMAQAPIPAPSEPPAGAPAGGPIVIMSARAQEVILAAGERQGITQGTEMRVMRGAQEVARLRVTDVSFATSEADILSIQPATTLSASDRVQIVGTPPPYRKPSRFPWAAVVGAGILALAIIGMTNDDDDNRSPSNNNPGGSATVNIN